MQNLLQVDLLFQVSGMTPGRAATILPAVMGLISLIVGWLAFARSAGNTRSRQIMAIVALVLGLIDLYFSGVHLARATGGIGTGSGRLGAIVALILGLTGLVLGGLAFARSRRMATGSSTTRHSAPGAEHK
jgi:FtsH-binding integral membrane protein